VYKGFCFTTSLPGFVVVFALNMVILTGMKWNLHVILICISFIAREDEQFFMYILAICTSSFENSLFNLYAQFFFGDWSFWVPCRYWILVSYRINSWQRFSLKSSDSLLSLVTVSFAVQKLSSLMQSHLLIFLDVVPCEFCLQSHSFCLSVPVYFLLLSIVVSKF
jgi:hypothetical protein